MAQQLMPWEEAALARQNPGGAIIKRADETLPLKQKKLQQDIDAGALKPLVIQQQLRTAAIQQQIAEQKLRESQKPTSNLTPLMQSKLMGQKTAIPTIIDRVDEIENLYDQDFSGSGLGALKEYLPGAIRPVNQTLDDAGRSLLGPLAQAFGMSAQEQNTPLEVEMRFGPYLPKHGERDEVNRARIARLRKLIETQQRAVAEQLGEPLPASVPPTTNEPAPPPPMGLAKGSGPLGLGASMREEYDPQLSSKLSRAIKAGLSFEKAAALVPGHELDRAEYMAAVRWAKTNPGYKRSLAEVSKPVPTTFGQRLAASPVAAYAAGAGNALTAGTLDEIAGGVDAALGGNYEETRDRVDANKSLLRGEHSVADFIGNVTGAGLGAYGLTRVPGVLNALGRAPRLAPVVGDVLYGGTYGAGESNANRLGGGAIGAGAGLAGGIAGRAAVRKLSNVVGGAPQQPAVQRLVDKGFVLSPAQRAAGNETMMGGVRKRIDDALTSAPILGDAIAAQRVRQFDQLGRATVEEALAPVGVKIPAGKSGNELIEAANEEVSRAYDRALPGIQAPLDPPFIAANDAVRASAAQLPQVQREAFDTIYQRAVTPFIPRDGVLTGKALQDIKRGLDKQIIRLAKTDNPADEYLADELVSLRGVFFDWAGRAAPAKVQAFRNANAAFANMVRVNRAAAAAKADGRFTPNQLLGAVKANSSDAQFASGGLPMQQLGQDAQNILPSIVPDSGTALRAANLVTGGAVAGGGAMLPALTPYAALPALKTLQHLPGIDKLLQVMALQRRAGAVRAGQAIRNRQQLGGLLTVPMAVQGAIGNQ